MKASLFRHLSVVVTVLVALAACGLSLDESPREISSASLDSGLRPGQLPTPQAASESGPGREQVHLVQEGNRLVTVERQIFDTPEQLMDTLLLGAFAPEAAEGITTAISRGTEVHSIDVNELLNLAIVDLKPGSLDSGNTNQRLAFAQIVYTLTSLAEIEQVQFVRTDPENPDAERIDLPVQTDNGTTLPGARVSREDFALLSPDNAALPTFDIAIATPTPLPDPNAPRTFESSIWMLDEDDKLAAVSRTIERSPDAYLVAVLEGVTPEERDDLGLRSALPPDALANPIEIVNSDAERTDDLGFTTLENLRTAIVDFEPSSLPSVADANERFLAVAQIVVTLTQLEEIDQVAISVDGVFIPMPIDGEEGTVVIFPFEPNVNRGVDRRDYQTALPLPDEPTPAPTAPPVPTAVPPTGASGDAGTFSTPPETPAPELTPTPTPTVDPTTLPPTPAATVDPATLPPTPTPTPGG